MPTASASQTTKPPYGTPRHLRTGDQPYGECVAWITVLPGIDLRRIETRSGEEIIQLFTTIKYLSFATWHEPKEDCRMVVLDQ